MIEQKRDLLADLALIESATSGPWTACRDGECDCGLVFGDGGEVHVAMAIGKGSFYDPHPRRDKQRANMKMIAEARTGWPHAIKRALEAEDEVERLKRENEQLIKRMKNMVEGFR